MMGRSQTSVGIASRMTRPEQSRLLLGFWKWTIRVSELSSIVEHFVVDKAVRLSKRRVINHPASSSIRLVHPSGFVAGRGYDTPSV